MGLLTSGQFERPACHTARTKAAIGMTTATADSANLPFSVLARIRSRTLLAIPLASDTSRSLTVSMRISKEHNRISKEHNRISKEYNRIRVRRIPKPVDRDQLLVLLLPVFLQKISGRTTFSPDHRHLLLRPARISSLARGIGPLIKVR